MSLKDIVKVLVCWETITSHLLASQLVAAGKLQNHVKKCYFQNQQMLQTDHEFDRWTSVGSLQALLSFLAFADTHNILIMFSECDQTPNQGPIYGYFCYKFVNILFQYFLSWS